MNKEQAKEKIKKLVERYEKLSDFEKKKYNEQQTKDHFIRPLFEALGWDFEHDVWPETDVSGKRVDYAFKINGVTKFFIEAKPISVNLDEERWAEQAINYSWHKSVPWVILTDFEAIKVYNTEWDEPNIQSCQYIEIPYSQYLTNEQLWWLSKESFEKGVLDAEAEKAGRRPKKIIDKQLAEDLVRWRNLLFENLKIYNRKIEEIKIAEYVQTILDRLIFIRTLEDRKIEDVILQPLARGWEEKGGNNKLLYELNKVFRRIDKDYNSGLFEEGVCDHLAEKIEAEDQVLAGIINDFYHTKGKGIRYNFADIPSDIFGSMYEQYLGYIQKEEVVENKQSKRKSQGIYYTPRYIVEYIVQNTLGEILKEKKPEEIKDLKILDPACGSGSFLISAYQILIDYWQKQNKNKGKGTSEKLDAIAKEFAKKSDGQLSAPEKMRILLNNIHGVDLDEEAVEIARLNLLLKMVGQRGKLPKLESNICVGNSLISGTPEELEKYFGKDWKTKKPFNWEERFADVFKQGGFDVIVGNPPYIQSRNLNDEERHYYWDNYLTDTNHSDIYSFFIEKSINLLINGGLLALIIPDTWLQIPSFKSLRRKIFNDCMVRKVLFFDENLRVFQDAQVSNVIVVLQKEKNTGLIKDNKISIVKCISDNSFVEFSQILQSSIDFEKGFNILGNKKTSKLLEKISNQSTILSKIVGIIGGLRTGDDGKFLKKITDNKDDRKLLRGRNIEKYSLAWGREYVWYRPDLMKVKQAAAPKEAKFFEAKEKLLVRMITGSSIIATYDDEGYYFLQDNLLLPSSNYNLKYILAILNSRLANFVVQGLTSNIAITQSLLKDFPIYKFDLSNKKDKTKHDGLVDLADKMLKLNKELKEIDSILDKEKYQEKQKEIEKTDHEIDRKVYELYGLTAEEIKIVEGEK